MNERLSGEMLIGTGITSLVFAINPRRGKDREREMEKNKELILFLSLFQVHRVPEVEQGGRALGRGSRGGVSGRRERNRGLYRPIHAPREQYGQFDGGRWGITAQQQHRYGSRFSGPRSHLTCLRGLG